MTIDIAKLDGMELEALKALAIQCGAKHHHKAGKDKIIEAIKNHVFQPPQPTNDLKHPAEKPKEAVFNHTEEDVEKLVAHLKAKSERFVTKYPGDGTVLMRWVYDSGKVGMEESVNMSVPPRVIKNRAEIIARGPAVLKVHSTTNFDPGNATGLSSYTNVVLA